jgi:hypothetical protein
VRPEKILAIVFDRDRQLSKLTSRLPGMGNVIPWSQIHPTIKSEEPFLAVVVVDSRRELCVSEMVEFDPEALVDPGQAAGALVAAAQSAAARVAGGYRLRRSGKPEESQPAASSGGLRVLRGGLDGGS